MGTINYNLPKITGMASVKIPRDFNALADAVDAVLKDQAQSSASAVSAIQATLTSIDNFNTSQKAIVRTGKVAQSTLVGNPSLVSKPNVGSYNLMQSQDLSVNNWYQRAGVTLGEKIVVNGIELTKVTTSNFYNSLSTKTKVWNTAYPLALDPAKKYLCSAYCFTNEKPRFFYHKTSTSAVNEAVYVDNNYDGFGSWWMVVSTNFFGISKESLDITSLGQIIRNNIYMGGFQIEEITPTKNGIAFMGDSTVQGAAGTNDSMQKCGMGEVEWQHLERVFLQPWHRREPRRSNDCALGDGHHAARIGM